MVELLVFNNVAHPNDMKQCHKIIAVSLWLTIASHGSSGLVDGEKRRSFLECFGVFDDVSFLIARLRG